MITVNYVLIFEVFFLEGYILFFFYLLVRGSYVVNFDENGGEEKEVVWLRE